VIALITFLFGIVIGSFLNVCIHRLPRGESIVTPRSRCPHCAQQIAGYDNIPLLSYVILGGRCRHCKARISPVYFFVELATGLMFVLSYHFWGLTPEFTRQVIFGSLLIVLVMTDFETRLLPDRVTFPGMALGLVFALIVPVGDGAGNWLATRAGLTGVPIATVSVLDALLGALAGGGLLYGLGELYFRLRHREGMGLGDVKMMAMVGLFLGPKLTLLTILLGSVGGSVIGLLLIAAFRKQSDYELPFGTFLGFAAFAASLWGWVILDWYRGFFL
jgi:leader peptidase (prepilin peptidase) / N-methyltransferase